MQNPEGSEDLQNENPGVSKVEISQGTPGFGGFEEPLAIPNAHGRASIIFVTIPGRMQVVSPIVILLNAYLISTLG